MSAALAILLVVFAAGVMVGVGLERVRSGDGFLKVTGLDLRRAGWKGKTQNGGEG